MFRFIMNAVTDLKHLFIRARVTLNTHYNVKIRTFEMIQDHKQKKYNKQFQANLIFAVLEFFNETIITTAVNSLTYTKTDTATGWKFWIILVSVTKVVH